MGTIGHHHAGILTLPMTPGLSKASTKTPVVGCTPSRTPMLRSASGAARGVQRRALTLTESLEPVLHSTTRKGAHDGGLELREGQPYATSDLLWGIADDSRVATDAVRRELEGSFNGRRVSGDGEAGGPDGSRQVMEREWQSAMTSTSGRGPARRFSSRRKRAVRRSNGAAGAVRIRKSGESSRARRRMAESAESLEQRRDVMAFLEGAARQVMSRRTNSSKESAVSMFKGMLLSIPLLARPEERVLTSFIQAGQEVQEKKNALQETLGREPSSQEVADACESHIDDINRVLGDKIRAKSLLVKYNLRFVMSVAMRYAGKGIDLEDLLTEGVAGLDHATEKFDPGKGLKFSTYAYYWIRQSVTRCISNHSRVVRLPGHVWEAVSKINRVTAELRGEVGVTDAKIADRLGLSEEKIRIYRTAGRPAWSLDAPSFQHGSDRQGQSGVTLIDEIASDKESAHDELDSEIVLENLKLALNTLHPRERNVLRMRYGLHTPGGIAIKHLEISLAYGLSPERIRQIEKNAILKLRLPWRRSLLFDDAVAIRQPSGARFPARQSLSSI